MKFRGCKPSEGRNGLWEDENQWTRERFFGANQPARYQNHPYNTEMSFKSQPIQHLPKHVFFWLGLPLFIPGQLESSLQGHAEQLH
jgi:hypothetical protein